MKGLNGLEDQNLFIIVTWLASTKYAELNVLGQWLGKNDMIDNYYRDQINQAVGRNRGFRQSESETKTAVVASPSLWKKFLCKVMLSANRVRLYQDKGPAWL